MGFKTSGAPRSARKFSTRRRRAAWRAQRRLAFRLGRFLFPDRCRFGGRFHQTTSPASSMRNHLRMIWRARRRSQRFSEIRPQCSSRNAFSSRQRSFLTQRSRRNAEFAEDDSNG